MKLIWKAPDDALPTKRAIEWAIRSIAAKANIDVPDDATVTLDNEFILGSYPLVQAIGPDGDTCWFVQYERVLDELIERTDSEMRAAGEDPADSTDFRRQIWRLVRRQLVHWPQEMVDELNSVLVPILNEVIADIEDHHGHDNHAS